MVSGHVFGEVDVPCAGETVQLRYERCHSELAECGPPFLRTSSAFVRS